MMTKLRSKVIKSGVAQYRIAGITNIHPSTLSEYIWDKRPIRPSDLAHLCEFFQCDAADLLGTTDDKDIIESIAEQRPLRRRPRNNG